MPRTLFMIDGSPPSRAVWMACKALGIDIDIRRVNFPENEHHEDWFLKMNPRHTVPTLDDDGFYLCESRSIMRYIADRYSPDSNMYPKDPQRRAKIEEMMDWDLGHIYKSVLAYARPQVFFLQDPNPDAEKDLKMVLEQLNRLPSLTEGGYVCGSQLTLADFHMFTAVTFLEAIDYNLDKYPHVKSWIERCKQLPYYEECNAGFQKWKAFMTSPKRKEMLLASRNK